MKKISIILCLILTILLVSCGNSYTLYNKESADIYFEDFYEDINNSKTKYVAYDLRTKENYEAGHVRQFQNFDISFSTVNEFFERIKLTNNKNVKVYLWTNSSDSTNYEIFEFYKNVYVLKCDYEEVTDIITDLFIIDTGEYNCGC